MVEKHVLEARIDTLEKLVDRLKEQIAEMECRMLKQCDCMPIGVDCTPKGHRPFIFENCQEFGYCLSSTPCSSCEKKNGI